MGMLNWIILGVIALFVVFMSTVIMVVIKNKGKDDGGPGSMGSGDGPPNNDNNSGSF